MLVKCPADAIYVQILAQTQTKNYLKNNLHDNSTYINLINDANDSYKQLLLSIGKYANQIVYKIKRVLDLKKNIMFIACSMLVFNLKSNIFIHQ